MAFTPGFEQTMAVKVESEGVGGFTGAMDDAMQAVGGFKRAVGLAGGALATFSAGALAAATSAAADFEEQMVEVEKVTSAETAAKMNESIRKMARDMPVAHQELATIAATAGRLGVEGPENIETFTRHVAKMAEATDLSAQDAADSFARMSKLMGLPISQTEELGSAINELSNNMGASSSEIVDAATRSSGVLSQLGLSSETILSLNGAMNEVSASSRIAGTQLRRFAQEITDPAKVEDLASALGMSTEEFKQMRKESPEALMKEMASAFGEGGEQAEALRSVLGTTSRQTLSKLSQNWSSVEEGTKMANQQFENATSLQEEFEAATSTFNSQIQQMKNNLRDVGIEIGNVVLPYLSKLLGSVNEFLTASDSVINTLSAKEKAFGLVGTTIGGLAATLVWLVGGPITLAIGAVAALGAAYATNFMGMKDSVDSFLGMIRANYLPTMDQIRAFTSGVLQKIRALWSKHRATVISDVRALAEGVKTVVRTFAGFLTSFVRGTLSRVRAFWKKNGTRIVAILRTYFSLARMIVRDALSMVLTLWREHGAGVLSTVRRMSAMVQNVFLGVATAVLQIIRPYLARAKAFWQNHGKDIMFIVRNLVGAVITVFRVLANTVMAVIRPFLALAGKAWAMFGDEIISVIQFAADAIFSTLGWLIDGLMTLIKAGKAAMKGDWKAAWNFIAGFFERTLSGILSFGKKWGTKLLNWISGALDGVVQAFKDLGNWLIFGSFVPDMFGKVLNFLKNIDLKGAITAPLDLMKKGIEKTLGKVKDLFSGAMDTVKNIAGGIKDAAGSAVSKAKDALSKAKSMASNAASAASNAASNAANTASNAASDAGDWVSRNVPGLAEGGVVTQPTLAMVGEGGESEAVVPLSKLERMMGGGGPSIGNVQVNASTEAEGRAAARGFTDELRSAGFRLE